MYSLWIKVSAILLLLTTSSASRINIGHSFSPTDEQERQIDILINAFNSAIEQYSYNPGDKAENLRSTLISLVDDPTTALHYNDISQLHSDESNSSENELWMSYLQDIDERFHFGITMNIKTNKPYCVDGNLAVVKVEKTIQFNGQTISIKEIDLITLPQNEKNGEGYRISEILSAQNYKGENDNYCSKTIEVDNESAELYKKRKHADNLFFESKDYLNAKIQYEFVLNKSPNDGYIKKQIELCTTLVKQTDYQNKADGFFQEGKFESAQYWYEKLIAEYSESIDTKLPSDRIKKCKEEIINTTYSKFIRKADEAFESNDFSNARYYYGQALQIKVSDTYAKSRLEQSKERDNKFANEEIQRVASLIKENSKNYGEYFRILMKYEGFGNYKRLTTRQYYNMVKLLDTKNDDVKRVMKFDGKDCKDYCRIYCKKLNDALKYETNPDWRDESERLLLNINKRNQK